MSEFVSVTALLTPYQAYQVEKWHKQNLGGYKAENLNIRRLKKLGCYWNSAR